MVGDSFDRGLPRRLRHWLGPRINRLAAAVGRPTTRVYPAGYVGTVRRPIGEFETELADGGFSWDPLSMYHYTPCGSSTDGSWAYRSGPLADRQTHVVLFAGRSDRTDVYAHDEFSWLRHPRKHVAEIGIRRERAVEEVRRWLDDRGVAYDRDSLVRRRARHAANRVLARLDSDRWRGDR